MNNPTPPTAETRSLVWTCRDGRKIKVSDMTTQHIRNTLAMLERDGVSATCEPRWDAECDPNTDQMHEFWEPCSPGVLKLYKAMKNELENRK